MPDLRASGTFLLHRWPSPSPRTCRLLSSLTSPCSWPHMRGPSLPQSLEPSLHPSSSKSLLFLLLFNFQRVSQPPSNHMLFGIVNKVLPGKVSVAENGLEASGQAGARPYTSADSPYSTDAVPCTAVPRNAGQTDCCFQFPLWSKGRCTKSLNVDGSSKLPTILLPEADPVFILKQTLVLV